METAADRPTVLWCHPRSLSTAFERAFLQREDEFVCYHEPFGEPYYFGEEAMSGRFKQGATSRALTYMQVLQGQVLKEHFTNRSRDPAQLILQRKHVFVKDMAQYIVLPSGRAPIEEDNPTVIPKHLLLKMRHTFLLRDPHKSIPSYWRVCVGDASRETGFHFYDPDEAGYAELRTLFDYVCKLMQHQHQHQHQTPLLISAEDLLHDPLPIMQLYCQHVGVPFRPDMLHWEAKRIPSFDNWPGFHREAQQSMGFGKFKCPPSTINEYSKLPKVVYETIQDNLPHYKYLLQFKRNNKTLKDSEAFHT